MKLSVDYKTIKAAKRSDPNNPITAAFNHIVEGIKASPYEYEPDPNKADVVFVFGSITVRKLDTERATRIVHWRTKRKTIIALDSAFFSTYIRNHYMNPETYMFRVGLGDCTGEGKLLVGDEDGTRYDWFKQIYGFEEKPTKAYNDAPILFLLQSEKGWQYNSQMPYNMWARGVVERIRKLTTRSIILRGHPNLDRNPTTSIAKGFDNIRITQADRRRRSLIDDLEGVGAVVTHSSSAAIESYVEGIPTFALDKRCVIYDYLDNDLGKINNLSDYNWSNREQNLKDWACTSWHVTEMVKPEWINYIMSKVK